MKKIVRIVLVMVMIASLTTITKATEVSVNLSPEKDKVQQGAEIKVVLEANDFTREGSSKAIEARLSYVSEKLEYKKIDWKNGWAGSISSDGTGIAGNKTGEIATKETIAEITYKVKDNATLGKTKITASEIITSANGDEVEAEDVETEIEIIAKETGGTPGASIEKSLISIEVEKIPNKTIYTEGEKFDKSGMVIKAKYSDGTSKEIETYSVNPSENLKVTDTKVVISYTESNITKSVEQKITVKSKVEESSGGISGENKTPNASASNDKTDGTKADKEYPNTGAEKYILPICLLGIISVGSYVGYRKYKEI